MKMLDKCHAEICRKRGRGIGIGIRCIRTFLCKNKNLEIKNNNGNDKSQVIIYLLFINLQMKSDN